MEHLASVCDSIQSMSIPVLQDAQGQGRDVNNHLPASTVAFDAFPRFCGWEIRDDSKLDVLRDNPDRPHNSPDQTRAPLFFDVFLQHWLYFGLIQTVVQKNGRPLLSKADLCAERDSNYVSTRNLNEKIEQWVQWEISNPENRPLRLVQSALVLTKARSVVRRNCSCEISSVLDVGSQQVQAVHSLSLAGSWQHKDARSLDDGIALSLMVVGECLWAAHMRIAEQCKEHLFSWHGDDDAGWGPPAYVLKKMKTKKWCPRTVRLLQGQLRSSATLMLHAYSVYKDSERMTDGHQECTQELCNMDNLGSNLKRKSQCVCEPPCARIGPAPGEVQGILREKDPATGMSRIPLLRFVSPIDKDLEFAVERVDLKEGEAFATISHVWSDGWGNDVSNDLHVCQLHFIRRQLRQLPAAQQESGVSIDIPFWMDTLIIPVAKATTSDEWMDDTRPLRTTAIKQIFQVFAKSSYTIVLDKGLCSADYGLKPVDNAMRLLASGWMRRLWTLHEAFLSKEHRIAFKELPGGRSPSTLISLQDLLERLDTPDARNSPLDFWVRRLLTDNIMYKKSELLSRTDTVLSSRQITALVCEAWRAAGWREHGPRLSDSITTEQTTSHITHEALALATLLKVNYDDTEIERDNWNPDCDKPDAAVLIHTFWREFHATYLNCIPPGIIFLPGKKLAFRGYGWAPETWLSAHEVDFPDPMASWAEGTNLLEQRGLIVKYPGYLLIAEREEVRQGILSLDHMTATDGFTFAADNSFLEWYTVRHADPLTVDVSGHEGLCTSQNQLAIILSRPPPSSTTAEIGLLVEIYRTDEERTLDRGDGRRAKRYMCHRIMRVHVSRATKATKNHDKDSPGVNPSSRSAFSATTCIGQSLPATQTWVVDSRLPASPLYARAQAPPKTPLTENLEGNMREPRDHVLTLTFQESESSTQNIEMSSLNGNIAPSIETGGHMRRSSWTRLEEGLRKISHRIIHGK